MAKYDDDNPWEARRLALYIMIAMFMGVWSVCQTGCGDLVFGRRTVLQEGGDIPQEEELSFQSKEALAAGATLQNYTAAQVYYEGAEPKSEAAKLLYDLSYRFLGLVGVKMDFDPGDPASIKKIFEKADKALEEKDRNLHELKEALKKEQETREVAERATKSLVGRVWGWVWGILGTILGLLVLAGLIEVFTGVPLISWAVPWIQKRIRKVKDQTIKGVQAVREDLKEEIENGGSDEEKKIAKRILARIDQTLSDNQDEEVKVHIKELKAKGLK